MFVTPITSPRALNSGPPELPGLICVVVWIYVSPSKFRRRLETMPWLTLRSSPSGLPIANTVSPSL